MSAAVPTGWVPDSRSPRGAGAEGQVVSVPVPLGVVSPGGGGLASLQSGVYLLQGLRLAPPCPSPKRCQS